MLRCGGASCVITLEWRAAGVAAPRAPMRGGCGSEIPCFLLLSGRGSDGWPGGDGQAWRVGPVVWTETRRFRLLAVITRRSLKKRFSGAFAGIIPANAPLKPGL